MEKLLSYAANYGFPMVVCAYLLVRIEGKLDQVANGIHELSRIIGSKV